jgi:pSer/pThr/pTyr-binding forkhead associated (FHA) protein
MVSRHGAAVEKQQQREISVAVSSISASMSMRPGISISQAGPSRGGLPVLTLANDSLNIRIVAMNGAIIGRRKGPYIQFFEQHSYVSGVHAQLKYKSDSGWCVIDKHSSNGTRVNQRPIQPDVEMTLNNGDILTIANINLQVIIR